MNSKTQRIIINEFAAPGAAGGFSVSRTISLTAAAFSNITVGDWVYIIRGFCGSLSYDLAATAGQFQDSEGYFSIDNFNDQGIIAVKAITGANGTIIYVPTRVYHPLDMVFTTLRSNIQVTGTISPGTGITGASLNSIRIGFTMTIDLIPSKLWDSDYAFDILRKGQ